MSGFCSLDGKTALVTGASRGIGRAIAVELAAAGASVVVGYRSGQDEAEEVAKEIGGRAVQADVSDAASALALVEAAGDLDILVNNAGLTRDGLLARMSDDDWRTVIDTNLSSVFYTCRAVTRPMMKKRAGAIVNVSSIVGVHGNWGQTNYAASKAGIIGFTKSLAKELGSRNVRANVVAPGYVQTQLTDVLPEEATDGDARRNAARPARRSGRRRRRRSLPLLRRGLVRDGRSPARRRRPRDVAWVPVSSDNGRRRIVVTGIGAVTSLGNTVEDDLGGVDRGPLRRGPDHAVRHDRLPGALRLRGAGPRGDRLRRLQGVAPHGPVHASRARRRAPGRGRLGARDRADRRPRRRRRRDAASAASSRSSSASTSSTSAGPDRVNPFSIVQIIPNLAAGWVSIELGTRGPLLSQCTACAASNMAIGDGLDAIRLGRADVMICGGTEAPVTTGRHRRLRRDARASRAATTIPQAPRARSTRERDGFVMGEAAGMVVLEELEHAKARGAKIYAELLGYGVSSDANHVSDPDPTGENPARALTMAFADAGIEPEEVGYVNAHGTSTPVGRHGRDARAQGGARRGQGLPHADLVDEGRDRATASARPARSRRSSRSSRSSAGSCRRRSTRRRPTRRATSTTSRTRRATSRSRSASRTRSASAATTPASCSAAGTTT